MLVYSIIMFIVAVIFIWLGIMIYKGKTDLIHEYHQTKVTNKLSYGKAFGKGVLIIALSLLISGIIGLIEDLANLSIIILIIGLCIGIGYIVIIQMKYNKGIF